MSKFHQTIINLTCFEDHAPTFKSAEEQLAYQAMIGRMVMYGGLVPHAEVGDDTYRFINLMIRKGEAVGSYYQPVTPPRHEGGLRKYFNSPDETLAHLQEALTERLFITIGAVQDHDGKWGFHS